MIGWKPQSILIALSIILAGVMALLPKWTGIDFTPAESVIVGVTVLSASLLGNVLLLLHTVARTRQGELEQWRLEDELNVKLAAIRDDYAALVNKRHGDDDLFVAHYKREITELSSNIHKSSQLDELWVTERHSQTVDKVMSAFLEETKPVHRSVWFMVPNEELFEIQPDREYLGNFEKAATKRSFGGVRTLCVVESHEHLKDVRIKAVLDFYKTTPKFDCRVVVKVDYERERADDQISPEFIDFGIYGSRMMFLTASYEEVRKGVFVRRKADVAKYTEFFDRLWNSRAAKKNPSIAKDRLRLDDLIAIDEREQCEMTQ